MQSADIFYFALQVAFLVMYWVGVELIDMFVELEWSFADEFLLGLSFEPIVGFSFREYVIWNTYSLFQLDYIFIHWI